MSQYQGVSDGRAEFLGYFRDAYDMAHRFPFGYRELVPYYEWVEARRAAEAIGHV